MYVTYLEIKNLRCFKETKIELQHPDRNNSLKFKNINLLLGNNGSGKSSILKAIALATLYPVLQKSSGLVLYRMVRDDGKKKKRLEDAFLNAEILLHNQDIENQKLNTLSTINLKSKIHRFGDIEELLEFRQRPLSNATVDSSKKLKEQEYLLLNQLNDVPNKSAQFVKLSKNYQKQGRLEEAESILREALHIDLNDLTPRIELAKIYQAQRRFSEAELILRQVLEITPIDVKAKIELAKLYQYQNKFEEAESILYEVLRISPNNLSVYTELSRIYQAQHRLEEAENILFRALKFSQSVSVYNELAKIYQNQNKLNDAESILRRIIEIQPDNPIAYIELAKIYRKQNNFDEAERTLYQAIEINPNNISTYTDLSKIYQERQNWYEAESILLRAIELTPDNLAIRGELSRIYNKQNRFHDAESILIQSKNITENIIKEMFEDYSPAFLVVGYGVTRRIEETTSYNFKEQSKIRRLRYSRVASLFENNYGLVPLQSWLPEMKLTNKGRYTQVVHLIDHLTPEDMSFKGEFINDEFYCNFRGVKTPFGALSDGYRHFVGWIADLLYHICMGAPSGKKLVDNQGIVLVDEIDLLLHPEWQRSVIEALSKNLPNLQFVFTTHSPIVASSVEKENVFVMETDSDGSAVVKQFNESIYGLTAEQVLLSSYFGLETTRPKSFVKEEIEPISNKALKGKHEDAIEFMRRLTTPIELDKTKFSDFLK